MTRMARQADRKILNAGPSKIHDAAGICLLLAHARALHQDFTRFRSIGHAHQKLTARAQQVGKGNWEFNHGL